MKKQIKSTRNYNKTTNRLPIISQFGLICSLFFVFFSLLGRFLYPFGDEPDFIVRSTGVINGEHSWWSPYSVFEGLFGTLTNISNCEISGSPLSLWSIIDVNSCSEPTQQVLTRFLLTLLIVWPLLIPIIFRRIFAWIVNLKSFKLNTNDYITRLDALALSTLLPSVIYSLGIFAEEQFVLVMGLLIFMLTRKPVWIAIFISLIISIDLGNGIVVLGFFIFLAINTFIVRRFGFRRLFLFLTLQTTCVLFIGINFLNYLQFSNILIAKADSIYYAQSISDVTTKYPVILRPIITFMSGIFMTPAYIKVLPLYILFGITTVIICKRLITNYTRASSAREFRGGNSEATDLGRCGVQILTAFSTVLFFVFILPGYSNAKYYLFMTPFIINAALHVLEKKIVFLLLISGNVVVFASLFLYGF